VDTTDWSKLHCNVDLSQNVSWISNQEGSDERESREVHVTFPADVLEAIYGLRVRRPKLKKEVSIEMLLEEII
jgi:hypothetical protein